ncbi:MAG: vitamin B12 dependent methionine synthase [Clostridia bacterium]|nr:vitamin B12 dependent methionine synthase [Clostridia bacterium]
MVNYINVKKVVVNSKSIASRMRLSEQEDIDKINEMCEQAVKIAKPKAIYKVCFISHREETSTTIDDISFDSTLMSRNFKDINRVFPFIATCGREIYNWANTITDVFERYWADYIMESILRNAIRDLYDEIREKHGVSKISSMNPGSLSGWPINQQQTLFSLLEQPDKKVGVELTETFLMIPQKSVSGILFPSGSDYVNCRLCDREICENRRAEYDEKVKKQLQG